jgi:hypothetical protein
MPIGPSTNRQAIRPAGTASARLRQLPALRCRHGIAAEDHAGSNGERAGHVAPRRAVLVDVDDVEHAVDEREAAERECERRPQPGPQRREREHAGDARGD